MEMKVILLMIIATSLVTYAASQVSPECYQEMDPGPCQWMVPRWFFNMTIRLCDMFNYSGCGGNLNNFRTQGECSEKCEAQRYRG
ncbi:kunitz-like toxin PcKuz3 [Physella acuta]|uniref:kunitz-like toxin PcKuz3 n=1 Tax=Physella acuta TaxID=109671 RepID=UPI0027DBBA4F|nr:kunitz-like toxin PcKuz3 [Physella acuta]